MTPLLLMVVLSQVEVRGLPVQPTEVRDLRVEPTQVVQLVTERVAELNDAGTDSQILDPLVALCPPIDPHGAAPADGGWWVSDQQAERIACKEAAFQFRVLQLERQPAQFKFNWSIASALALVTVFFFGGLYAGWELSRFWMQVK